MTRWRGAPTATPTAATATCTRPVSCRLAGWFRPRHGGHLGPDQPAAGQRRGCGRPGQNQPLVAGRMTRRDDGNEMTARAARLAALPSPGPRPRGRRGGCQLIAWMAFTALVGPARFHAGLAFLPHVRAPGRRLVVRPWRVAGPAAAAGAGLPPRRSPGRTRFRARSRRQRRTSSARPGKRAKVPSGSRTPQRPLPTRRGACPREPGR